MKSRVFILTSLCALFAAMFAATALAQTTPGLDVYNPNGEVLNVVQGGGSDDTPPSGGAEDESTRPVSQEGGSDQPAPEVDTPVATSQGDSLPFTGFEAGLVALAGAALLGAGFAMRRSARKN